MKTSDQFHHGPYASLVREHTLKPPHAHHDYLKSPEIVEDIARCIGLGLQNKFEAQAKRCIVKFGRPNATAGAVEAAIHYVYAKMHRQSMGLNTGRYVDCAGLVLANAVVYVDEVDLGTLIRHTAGAAFRHEPQSYRIDEWPCRAVDPGSRIKSEETTHL